MPKKPNGGMTLRKLFSANCRRLRHENDWSQQTVANEIGVARARVAEVERASKDYKITTIEQFASVFGKHPYEMLMPLPTGGFRN